MLNVVTISTKVTSVFVPDMVIMLTKFDTVPMLNVVIICTEAASVLVPDVVIMFTTVATVPVLNVVIIFTKITSVLVPDMVTTVTGVPVLNVVTIPTKVTSVLWLAVVKQSDRSVSFCRRFLSCFVQSRSPWQPSRPPSLNSRRRPLVFFPPPRVGAQRVSYPVGTGRSIPGGKVAGA